MKTTLDELQAFTHVVDAGSISAAAEQLGQTASGISRALSRLEDKLGVTLLRRPTRRLELTEEGALLLAQARRILAAVEDDVLLFGSEPSGAPDHVHAAADARVVIPIQPDARSLNLAVSAGIACWAARTRPA